jgi:glycosyltransferase involved in cell wall biosynthesis/GT2 family glycosyltransferase
MRHKEPVGRICIVANELNHVFRNGGIGTHNWLLAETLAEAGWKVHVLYCGPVEVPGEWGQCHELLSRRGIGLSRLEDYPGPPEDAAGCGVAGWIGNHSLQVLRALEALDASEHFELIEFAEWTGYGFRAVQARRMGSALTQARIIVKLHSSTQWCREGNRWWMTGADDLIRDYFERYSFEQADHQIAPCAYMLDYARSIGWNVRADAHVVANCFPNAEVQPGVMSEHESPELVFFGRLEARKGLKIFLDAVRSLPDNVPVAFLGRETPLDGIPASEFIAKALGSRPYTLHTQLDRQQAISFLASGKRLAVLPSLIENFPNTVIECAVNGIPFVASNVGGIPEIVADEALQSQVLFEPTARALGEKLKEHLSRDAASRQQIVRRLQAICDPVRNRTAVVGQYAQILAAAGGTRASVVAAVNQALPQRRSSETGCGDARPLVSLVVPYYNMGDCAPETLASLAAQDYPNCEVIVVNDGSTDPASLEVWEQMQTQHPAFRFISQDNQGLGAARNAGLTVARGEFFLPVDADNIARPEMVTRYVRAMQRRPELSVATCYYLGFRETADIANGKFPYAYRPCGGSYVAAALRNVYGDANAIFRTAALRSVGGFETERDTTCEDWEIFVKLVREGHQLDVVPEYLFYYRYRETSLLRTTDTFRNRQRVLRQFFTSSQLPRAEQIALWNALASFDMQQRQAAHGARPAAGSPPPKSGKRLSAMKRAMRGVKQVMRQAPYYSAISTTLKQWKQRAA